MSGQNDNNLLNTSANNAASPCSSPSSPRLQLPSPIITKRTRTASTSARALVNPIEKGTVKSFSRNKGHGFITPASGGEDLFLHISDIEGEYIPMTGDEVEYRLCAIPPKYEKHQAIHVNIINFSPEVHLKWEDINNDSNQAGQN